MSVKTSEFKKIPASPDWVQVEQESQSTAINFNQVEEVSFYPSIAGEPALTISYASGKTREIHGAQALALWNLVQGNLKGIKLPKS